MIVLPVLTSSLLCASLLAPTAEPSPKLVPANSHASAKTLTVKLGALEDLSVKTDHLLVNNVCLNETVDLSKSQAPPGYADVQPARGLRPCVISVRMGYRTRSMERVGFTVVVTGLDEEGEPLWAGTASEIVGGNVTDVVSCVIPVIEDTLSQTATVKIRVMTKPLSSVGIQPPPPPLPALGR